ncbi:hypothetical protein GJ496_001905 [Pomphorhynchus laevis]|nr:hypothetical protein GJ496_001905 [Pomphorhynchus laevis]
MMHVFIRRTFINAARPITIKEVHHSLTRLVDPHHICVNDANMSQVREIMMKNDELDQSELEPKSVQDSYTEAVIPLALDSSLREEYRNFVGSVRTARILEDLDTMAVNIAYSHNIRDHFINGIRFSPLAIVTAAVKKIAMSGPLELHKNVMLCGNVYRVGKSSCHVRMTMKQEVSDSNWNDTLDAEFVLVAKNPATNRAIAMNPLNKDKSSNPDETNGSTCKITNKFLTSQKYTISPNLEESKLIHDLYLSRTKVLDGVSISNTILKSAQICEPQFRNIYGKIFGGFLMRSSYELAWTNTRIFAKSFPKIVIIGDISFERSVEIGSILSMSSVISYTKGNYIVNRVTAEVIEPDTKETYLTNTFYYIFETSQPSPAILPTQYSALVNHIAVRRFYAAFDYNENRKRRKYEERINVAECDKFAIVQPVKFT